MVRSNESWNLGEPEITDRGQPVIHDVACKLGCIRASSDLLIVFPEKYNDFTTIEAQHQAAQSPANSEGTNERTYFEESTYSQAFDLADPVSDSESEHSSLPKEYNQFWSQQRQPPKIVPDAIRLDGLPLKPLSDEKNYRARISSDASCTFQSSIDTDLQAESLLFQNDSPFPPWLGQNDFMGPVRTLDLIAHYSGGQQMQGITRASAPDINRVKTMQLTDNFHFANEMIDDCSTGFDIADPSANSSLIWAGERETRYQMILA